MIQRVRLVRFKRFSDQTFDISGDTVLLAGPNNSGKTTLLHALSAWNLAVRRWREERGDDGGKRRLGVGLDQFTALPLREMNLLWLNRHTATKSPEQKTPRPAPVFVEVTFSQGARNEQSLTMEFLYADKRLVYVRPVKSPDDPSPIDNLPEFAKQSPIVHVPAFSGIGSQETHYASTDFLDKLIGEGKPGDILRNLLLEIWTKSQPSRETSEAASTTPWSELQADMKRLFECELLQPQSGTYILCEYVPRPHPLQMSPRPPKLDIANAGSGFHQVLLLLAFLYARPASVLLLDEPDAHLHFILQREVYDHLRAIALKRNCKLVIATHSEVLLENTGHEQIISFVSAEPRRLARPEDKQRLRNALRKLSSLDMLQADQVGAVLYLEDDSDHKLLREWASILDHSSKRFLRFPFLVRMQGSGGLDDAKRHFQSLRLVHPAIKGICLIDRDQAAVDAPRAAMPEGLALHRWKRYEIENYLLNPEVLKRYVSRAEGPLFGAPGSKLIDDEFAANFPANTDYLKDIPVLRDLKASEFIVELLRRTECPLEKRDLYVIAQGMLRSEIHPDVEHILAQIAELAPDAPPSLLANLAPLDEGVNEEGE